MGSERKKGYYMFKITLNTIVVIIITIFFVIFMFIDNLLNIFDFAKIPLKELNRFHQSKQIIKQLKTNNKKYQSKIALLRNRHQVKKINTSKQVQRRLNKKIPSLLVTNIPIIGAVVAVSAIIKFEVDDYCKNKKELINDENILFDTNKIFDETACLDDVLEDAKKFNSNKYQNISSDIESKWDKLW